MAPHPKPRISVVICNYNYGAFVEQAVRSAFEQSVKAEIVIVDDGSTDDSLQVLGPWEDRVHVIRQRNQGQRAAYGTGFAATKGEFVVFLDADDFLLDGALERILTAFDEGVAKVHFRMKLVDRDGSPLGRSIPSRLGHGSHLGRDLLKRGVLYPSAPGSGNAYRRTAIEGMFPLPSEASNPHGADFFLIYSSPFFGSVVAVPEVLAAYRIHERARDSNADLTFGNAASRSSTTPEQVFESKARQLREVLHARSGGAIQLPHKMVEFSLQKATFARSRLGGGYALGLRRGLKELPALLHSLYWDDTFSRLHKAALTGWALAVLVAPDSLARALARYVANPAARFQR